MSTPPSNSGKELDLEGLMTLMEELADRLVAAEKMLYANEKGQRELASRFENSALILRADIQGFQNSLEYAVKALEYSVKESKGSVSVIEKQLKTFDDRFEIFKERFVVLDSRLNNIELRNEKILAAVDKCPTIDSLVKELTDPKSPLATKSDLNKVALQLSELAGKVDGYFKTGGVILIATLAASVISGFFPNLVKPTSTGTTSPSASAIP